MSAADDTFAAAEAAIETARVEGSKRLDLAEEDFAALTRLPDSIGGLDRLLVLVLGNHLANTQVTDLSPLAGLSGLTALNLTNTQVTDLSPIAGLTGLKVLYLNNTPVADLTPLSGLTGLTALWLGHTPVADLTQLSGLTGLTALWLDHTPVADLTQLSGLTGLTWLSLDNTPVTDLTPLSGLTGLMGLSLNNTPVADLRPIRGLWKLAEEPEFGGLTFVGCAATRGDARIAEIAKIDDSKARAVALFAYLEDWVPPGEADIEAADQDGAPEADPPALPSSSPAPLETEVRDGVLSRAARTDPPLPPGPPDDRAREGWETLRDFRDDFLGAVAVSNYRPLAAAVGSFNRAMGDSYDEMREIGVGTHGLRIVALSKDATFVANLPDGAETELTGFATAIATFINRFPNWLAYLEEAERGEPVAREVQSEIETFAELAKALQDAADVNEDVRDDFLAQVDEARDAPEAEIIAKGLLASTRDLLRTLSEDAIIGWKLYRDEAMHAGGKVKDRAGREAREIGKLAPAELRKKGMWAVLGVTGDILVLKGGIMLGLARQFPKQLGWLEDVLRFLGLV